MVRGRQSSKKECPWAEWDPESRETICPYGKWGEVDGKLGRDGIVRRVLGCKDTQKQAECANLAARQDPRVSMDFKTRPLGDVRPAEIEAQGGLRFRGQLRPVEKDAIGE